MLKINIDTDKQKRIVIERLREKERNYLKNTGKPKVGYLCLRTPVEAIEALGAVPVRIIPRAGFDAGEYTFVRPDGCSFCRSIPAILKTEYYRGLAAIIAGACCDQMRRVMDTLRRELEIPVIIYGAPRTWDGDEEYYFDQMMRGFDLLKQMIGGDYEESKLREKIEQRNSLREVVNASRNTGKLGNSLLQAIAASPLPAEELSEFMINSEDSNSQGIRLMLAGSIPGYWEMEAMENSGVTIVADATCLGDRVFHRHVEKNGDIWRNLYKTYVGDNLCPHRRPQTKTIKYLKELAEARRVAGVIFLTLKYCHPWGLSGVRMKEELGLPFLRLDDDLTSPARGNFMTRVGAFVEMLKNRK